MVVVVVAVENITEVIWSVELIVLGRLKIRICYGYVDPTIVRMGLKGRLQSSTFISSSSFYKLPKFTQYSIIYCKITAVIIFGREDGCVMQYCNIIVL